MGWKLSYFSISFSPDAGVQIPQLSPADRDRHITDPEIVELSTLIASNWKAIARRLPDALRPGQIAFKLGTQALARIERGSADEEDRAIQLLTTWRQMAVSHNWGLLWTVLHECSHGADAVAVLKPKKNTSAGKEFWSSHVP